MLKHLLAGAIVAFAMASGAVAGPVEDAVAAYLSGDYATALKLLKPLAEQGNAEAQNQLGLMYGTGQGVPKDFAEAARWSRLAAEQGNTVGQASLGFMYEDGDGVPKDDVLAHMWFNLAAAQGYKDADTYRDKTAELMTPDQIAEAQRMARDWKPPPPR
jgi:TPR repeat protein